MTDFGELLKTLRTGAGLTQKQLAEKLGISKNAVSYYEKSLRCPSSDVLIRIARVFHVSADYLLGLDGERLSFNLKELDEKEREFLQYVYRFLCGNGEENGDDTAILNK